jgi:hypothetical protein
MKRRLVNIFFIFVICISPSYIKAADVHDKLSAELVATLNDFAKRNALSDDQIQRLVGDIVLNGQQFRKGGVGIINKDIFILLDEERNTVVLAGKKWHGKKSSDSEIVLTDGGQVLNAKDKIDIANLIILLFSPTEVRYINFSNNSGGKYLRGRTEMPLRK